MSRLRKVLLTVLALLLLGTTRTLAFSGPPCAVNQVKDLGEWTGETYAMPGETVECRTVFSLAGGREYVIRTRFSPGVRFEALRCLRAGGGPVNAAFFTLLTDGGEAAIRLSSRFSPASATELEIGYAVCLGDKAVCLPEKNLCGLALYGPDGEEITGTDAGIGCCSLSVFRGVAVAESGKQSNPLPGACFSIYRDRELTDRAAFLEKGECEYLACAGKDCSHTRHAYLLRTRLDGMLRLEGLKPGIYYLQECRTPEGYAPMARGMELVISPEGEITAAGVTVENGILSLSEPTALSRAERETKDPLAFYAIGCRVFAWALALMLLERRRLFR